MKSNAVNLKALIKLTEIFGLIPKYSYENKNFQRRRIYNFVLLALLGAFYGYFIYVKVIRLQTGSGNTNFALSTVIEVAYIFIYIFTVAAAVTWKFEDFCEFFGTYDSFDRVLLEGFKKSAPLIKYFNLQFAIIYLITLTEVFIDYWWFHRADFIYLLQYYFSHCLFLMTIVEYFFLKGINNRFIILNKILDEIDCGSAGNSFVIIKSADDDLSMKLKRIVKLHDLACDLVDYFNDLFGVQVLCVIFIHVIDILYTFQLMISQEKFENIIFSVDWMLLGIAQVVMVATLCEKIGSESKKTIALSFSLLYKFSSTQNLKEKLTILSQQANDRQAQFSAAGFFNVDFSMLFTFVNLITTYIIVIIQFSST